MPRSARVVSVGAPHHVTQRGNNRQKVFDSEQDYQVYLALLAERARQHDFRILGYRLLSNHVDPVVIAGRHTLASSRRHLPPECGGIATAGRTGFSTFLNTFKHPQFDWGELYIRKQLIIKRLTLNSVWIESTGCGGG